jgi:hypothetical protein
MSSIFGGAEDVSDYETIGTDEQDYLNRYPDVASDSYFSTHPYAHYTEYGSGEGRSWGSPQEGFDWGAMFEGMSFEMPAMPDYAAMMAEQTAAAEKAAKIAEMDNYWAQKYDAANQAVADINTRLKTEASQAATYGLDYTLDETGKANQINNRFAELWSEENESSLQGLISQYGTTKKWTSGIVRGTPETKGESTGSKEAGGKVASEKPRGRKGGTDDEDLLGGKKALLGE